MSLTVGWLFTFTLGAVLGAAVAYTACNWERVAKRLELHRDWPLEFEQPPFSRTVRVLPARPYDQDAAR